ncbi:hypothetical protein GCM10007858_22000 [Bradyrhizobium liaoningense]|nr:hypothetical protein GCM10007858_22000 [Bradyrhizobium liaoningense]
MASAVDIAPARTREVTACLADIEIPLFEMASPGRRLRMVSFAPLATCVTGDCSRIRETDWIGRTGGALERGLAGKRRLEANALLLSRW